jgi:hypothetical protein
MQTANKYVEKAKKQFKSIRREVAATMVEHEASINYARSRYNDTNTTGIVPNVTIMAAMYYPDLLIAEEEEEKEENPSVTTMQDVREVAGILSMVPYIGGVASAVASFTHPKCSELAGGSTTVASAECLHHSMQTKTQNQHSSIETKYSSSASTATRRHHGRHWIVT